MKKVVLSIFLLSGIQIISFSQANNPYSGFGKNYEKGVSAIIADIKTNGFKGADQQSLNYYLSILPFQASMNTEAANSIYEIQKGKKLDFAATINNNPKISAESKKFTLKLVEYPASSGISDIERYFIGLTNEIINSEIVENEKTVLLHLSDIAYNSATQQAANPNGKEGNCEIFGPNGSGPISSAICIIGSAAIGFWAGFELCGTWCGIGGAVVFGVLAAITVC
ncbi:MAG TPA: hypothetical protein PK872_01980 [Ferruginibacter sp.]|nr:hypothetical protein [Ferruginibacter sp.]